MVKKNKQVKKLLFQLVFSTYLHVVLLKLSPPGALIGWVIQLYIQQVPTCYTFGGPRTTKTRNT